MTTATAPASILPALVKAVRPFAFKGRRGPLALRDALVRHDGGSTSVTATDLEIACTIVACEPMRSPERYLVDAASGVPVGDAHDPAEFPAVDRLDGSPVAQFVIYLSDLKRIADHVASVTDPDNGRYALGGVLIENPVAGEVTMVGTNGRRLHAATVLAMLRDGDVPDNTILPGPFFAAAVKAMKAAMTVAGVKGRQADIQTVRVIITGTAAQIEWATDTVAVAARCKRIDGRFPQWRECLRGYDAGIDSIVPADPLAGHCRTIARETKIVADLRADVFVRENAAKGKKVAKGSYQHPRGVQFSRDGIDARGCEFSRRFVFAGTVLLDPEYVADAVDAATEFSGNNLVPMRVENAQSAVYLTAGGMPASGPGFLAIIMPMAAD
jgi:hypothetical protein